MLLSLSDFSDVADSNFYEDYTAEYAFGIGALRKGLNNGVMSASTALTKKRQLPKLFKHSAYISPSFSAKPRSFKKQLNTARVKQLKLNLVNSEGLSLAGMKSAKKNMVIARNRMNVRELPEVKKVEDSYRKMYQQKYEQNKNSVKNASKNYRKQLGII